MKKVLSILLVVITIISSFAFATNTFAASVPISCNDIYVKYISNGRAYIHFKWSSKNKKPFKNVEFFCICKDKEVDVKGRNSITEDHRHSRWSCLFLHCIGIVVFPLYSTNLSPSATSTKTKREEVSFRNTIASPETVKR